MLDDPRDLSFLSHAPDQAKVDCRSSGRRNGVGSLAADLRARHPANVKRGLVNQLGKFPSGPVHTSKPELAHEVGIVVGRVSDRFLFQIAERHDSVVEVFYKNAPFAILHGSEQLREHHRRVWCPVAVVAAVQLAVPAVYRDLDLLNATRTERDGLSAARMFRAIAD